METSSANEAHACAQWCSCSWVALCGTSQRKKLLGERGKLGLIIDASGEIKGHRVYIVEERIIIATQTVKAVGPRSVSK